MSDQPAASASTPQVHPLVHSVKWLLADLLSTLVFVALYVVTRNIYTATALGIAVGIGEIGYFWLRGIPIELMQWLSLFLVVVFGIATLLTSDPAFIMLKPTLIYAAVGIVMLKPGWMKRYVPSGVRGYGADLIFAFGYVWAALMFVTAALNAATALLASPAAWAWFIGVFPLASKIALFVIQYVTMRVIIRRRVRVAGQPAFVQ